MQVRLPSRMIIVLIIKPDLLLHPHPLAPPQRLQFRTISQRRCITRAGTRYRSGSVRMGCAVGRGRGSLGSRRRVCRRRSRRRCEEARHPRPQAHRRVRKDVSCPRGRSACGMKSWLANAPVVSRDRYLPLGTSAASCASLIPVYLLQGGAPHKRTCAREKKEGSRGRK